MAEAKPLSPWRYSIVLLLVGLSTVIRFLLEPVLGAGVPFILYFPTVVLSAWMRGLAAGLLATILSAVLAWYFFLDPAYSFAFSDQANFVQLGTFMLAGVLISFLAGNLHRAKGLAERSREEEREQRERLRVTLASIGDAVITTDREGRVTFMNGVAQELTGWEEEEARGRNLVEIFHIINEATRLEVESPVGRIFREGTVVGLANHTILISRDQTERLIDDSGAPIRNAEGQIIGAVLVFRDITEQRRSDEARARLGAIVESSDDAIIAKSLDGIISSWNAAAERIFGYRAEEVMGRHISIIIPPEHLEEEAEILEQLRRGERIDHYETRRVAKDGRMVDISLSISPIKDSHGQIIGAAKIARDISERKESEETIRSLLRISEKLNSTLDLDLLMETLVRESTSLVGAESGVSGLYTPEGMVSRSYYQNGEVVPLEYCWPPGHGLPGWLILHRRPYLTNDALSDRQIVHELCLRFGVRAALSTPILSARGEILGFFELHNKKGNRGFSDADIDKLLGVSHIAAIAIQNALAYKEIQRAEEALRESENLFRTLADSAPVMVWLSGPQNLRTFFNKHWLGFTGRTMDEELGQGWSESIHPEDYERSLNTYGAAFAQQKEFEIEYRLRRRDGEYRWVLDNGIPLYGPEKMFVGYIGSCTDITDYKRAAEEREQLLQLEQEARGRAEEANRLKDEFLATVSHELRTPLNAILGWARMLRDGRLDAEKAQQAIHTIERNARSQAQLVEDLLDVSRIITGKLRLDVQPIMPAQVIETALDSLRPAAEAKGIRLQSILDPNAGPISGDANRLQQMIWNLLSNAIKFTPRDGRVQLRLERVNSHIEVSVSDTGKGINPEFLPYVFDRFRQADSSITRAHGGLGLGLAIVRQLAELHGGTVKASSPGEGRGATFTIRLPLMIINAEPINEQRIHPRIQALDGVGFDSMPNLTSVRVLVVDDEADARLLLSEFLKQCGAEVKDADSACTGLKTVKEWRPDVIISDIGMPEEDGYAFIRRVKEWEREAGESIPALALTAFARVEDRMRALAAGYKMHIAKPVQPMELALVVASMAGRPRKRR